MTEADVVASRPDASIEPACVAGLPRRASLVGGLFLTASGLFPWFAAGAVATEPLQGRALLALALGVVVTGLAVVADRVTSAWQVATGVAAVVGLVLVLWSVLSPPTALTASLGVGLCAIGSGCAGLALFAARWRRRWRPAPADRDDPDGTIVDAASDEADSAPPHPSPTQQRSGSSRGLLVRVVGIGLALAVGYLLLWPAPTPSLASQASPTTSYEEAVERFGEVTADEADLNVYEPCESQLFTHGERTDVAVVLYHGLTNCPKQFVDMGTTLFDAGANVVILRAPEHGIANGDGSGIGSVANAGDLTAGALRDWADDSVDIAVGLGDEVRVLGLSMGGVVAAWTAQERADVDRVVAVAPAMTIPGVPASLTHVFRNVFDKVPNVSLPSAAGTLDHAYPGETTKGLDATFAMGAYVADQGDGTSPSADDVIVVLNPDDDQVDPVHLAGFAGAWATHGGPVTLHRLPAVGLPHDLIDPDQPEADPDLVYPILLALLDGTPP